MHPLYRGKEWDHIRVDIDPSVKPDKVDDIRTLAGFPDATADALFSSHNLEHLQHDDSMRALLTFHRVLRIGGSLILSLPDLQGACEAVAAGKVFEPLYHSPAGPIGALDMIFGYRKWTNDNVYMRHLTGFTETLIRSYCLDVGFSAVDVVRANLNLWVFAKKL